MVGGLVGDIAGLFRRSDFAGGCSGGDGGVGGGVAANDRQLRWATVGGSGREGREVGGVTATALAVP